MKHKIGDKCPYCRQELTAEIFALKAKIKGQRIKQGLAERGLRGEQIGAKKIANWGLFAELRQQGFTIRKIAKETGFSIYCVHYALKQLKKKEIINPSPQESEI